jgi:hypothetical protein
MLIKEYRIPVPMTVDEYRIAQLYMIVVGDEISFLFLFLEIRYKLKMNFFRYFRGKRKITLLHE